MEYNMGNFYKLAYGMVKGAGYDTSKMTEQQVFDKFKELQKDNKSLVPNTDDIPKMNKGKDLLGMTTKELQEKQKFELPKKENKVIDAKKVLADNYGVQHKDIIKKLNDFKGKPVGTYDFKTGELVNLNDGFMVTFHQNEADGSGHYKSHYGRYTEEEYDKLTNDFVIDNNAEVFIGVFDDEPEISFKVKTFEQAMALAIKHNQKSIWDNEEGNKGNYNLAQIKNKKYNKNNNPMRED